MAKSTFSLDTKAGIQRDGTVLDKQYYSDGEWVRFQRNRPRKIGGYREITDSLHGYSRGIYVDSVSNEDRIFSGYSDGIERVACDASGAGSGKLEYNMDCGPILTISIGIGGSGYTNGTYTNVSMTGNTGTGAEFTVVVAGGLVSSVTVTTPGDGYQISTPILSTIAVLQANPVDIGGTGSGMQVNIDSVTTEFTGSDENLWQFDGFYDSTGGTDSIIVAHPGLNLLAIDNNIETPLLTFRPDAAPLGVADQTMLPPVYTVRDSQGATPTDAIISISGGVVCLHPYVFVYGDNGLIKNCSAGNVYDWNSPDSNEANLSSQKIVKGLPIRGGSSSPSGLFWALDSLIRVSYSPMTVGAAQLYWRYDILGGSTILSSQSVVEYDGIYYWCGIDRFLLYNGVIKELPNNMNINWFYDSLNFAQRQKVWGTKVPRYGEIWWFYPRGDATECTDAIIYNVREQTWYDAGSSPGAQRSAGYFAQGFKYPVSAGTTMTTSVDVLTIDATSTAGNPSFTTTANMNIAVGLVVSGTGIPIGSLVTRIEPSAGLIYFIYMDQEATATGSFSATFSTVPDLVSLWQHEVGVDEIKGQNISAIKSMFETNDIGLTTGGPSEPSLVGDNHWLRIDRVEPDFVQVGEMELYVTGRPYAQQDDVTTGPYTFDATTGKIDLKQQRREMRLKFVSNTQGGDYQTGVIILSAEFGDIRGHS
jgi:hypothetical protein